MYSTAPVNWDQFVKEMNKKFEIDFEEIKYWLFFSF